MLYLNGVEPEKISSDEMISKVVRLVEEKAEEMKSKIMLPLSKVQDIIEKHSNKRTIIPRN